MTLPSVEVITSVERRGRWSREEKERLVAASFEAGVTSSKIASSAGDGLSGRKSRIGRRDYPCEGR